MGDAPDVGTFVLCNRAARRRAVFARSAAAAGAVGARALEGRSFPRKRESRCLLESYSVALGPRLRGDERKKYADKRLTFVRIRTDPARPVAGPRGRDCRSA